jgi:serine/threonine-protein kinase
MPGCQLCGGEHAVGPEACPEKRLGEVIAGKYVVEALLGCGGICAVYAAHHRILRRDIALKIVHQRYATDAELGARMVREARETAAIGHTAFVAVHDAGIAEDGCAYIEMARLEGRDLYTIRTTDGPLAPERAVAIAIDVLDALEALHARDVIHRDLKSSNIFIEPGEPNDRVRLLDLGMAKVDDEYNVTAPNQLLGTPFYISPEQLFDPRSVDARTDIFALGVVLFEVLTNSWPYQYENKKALLKRVMKGEIERHPAARRDEIPIWLDHVVARSLAFDREQRFATAAEMRAALERGIRKKSPSLLRRLFGRQS